jgi:DnaJ-class molecular chaperone
MTGRSHYHPDVSSGPDAGSRFREIADAYDVLKDPAQRAGYDDSMAPAARGRNDRAPALEVRRRGRDVPRFVDDGQEARLLVGELLAEAVSRRLARRRRPPAAFRARALRAGARARR